eukprot:365391-Chlamydomonas_euryale.AAC.8
MRARTARAYVRQGVAEVRRTGSENATLADRPNSFRHTSDWGGAAIRVSQPTRRACRVFWLRKGRSA